MQLGSARNGGNMKQKLANYLAETLVSHGITQNFSVTGGGAMHLNDAFGHQTGMYTLYQHHEQACAMAAEAYSRIYNRPALLCVTSGPGGTNAITGVLGAWLDSLPMIVISGQVRYDNTARWAQEQNGVRIRAMGDQEFDITQSIACMTKYCEMLSDPYRVRYAIEKCLYLSQTGRPGPCWLDIPVDIQGTYIETENLVGFDPADYEAGGDGWVKDTAYTEAASLFADENSLEKIMAKILSEGPLTVDSNEVSGAELMKATAIKISLNPHWRAEDSDCSNREKQPDPNGLSSETVHKILTKLQAAKRPIFYTGNGIRIAGAETLFLDVAHRLGIPVVVGWNAPDVIPTEDPLYVGRPGGRGDRPGNLAVQNADFILSIGSRLNIRQVGYNFKTWARDAYVIVNDIDDEELRKPSVHADMRVHCDARLLLAALLRELEAEGVTAEKPLFSDAENGLLRTDAKEICHTEVARNTLMKAADIRLTWRETCAFYRDNYPTVLPEMLTPGDGPANVYDVVDTLSRMAKENQITVVGNGSPCVAGGQAYIIKNGTRFISQDAVASMGYDLPAAIGACMAVHGPDRERMPAAAALDCYWTGKDEVYPPYEKQDIILLTGDGSIQMNLQELETIISHRMPIKIFIINNGGYHSIRQTQTNLFGEHTLVGIGVDSGEWEKPDLCFPDMEKLAAAYGYPFVRAEHNQELEAAFTKTLAMPGPAICEIMVSLTQQFLPKSAAKRLPDGSIVSPPLEDMAPYLPDDEMDKLMLVPRVEE